MSGDKGYTCKHVGTPEYELKSILIALREINKIPIGEMAQRAGVSVSRLREYERMGFLSDFYNEHYIQVLDEYVSLASNQSRAFREALKIYINQRGLYKLNITAKVTMFGEILYEALSPNMYPKIESEIQSEIMTDQTQTRYRVWNEERYDTAFFLLSSLRKMMDIESSEVAKRVGLSACVLKEFENGIKKYEKLSELRVLVISYAQILTERLKTKGVDKDVYKAISVIIENGYTLKSGDLRLKKILLDEIYSE